MQFSTFINRLKSVIGNTDNTVRFTKTIFDLMMNEEGPDLISDKSDNTFKSYYNGKTNISRFAPIVLSNLDDNQAFVSYLDSYGDTTSQLLADSFIDEINNINASNASLKIYDLFLDILKEASNKKNTLKSAKENNGEDIANLPEVQPSDKFPFYEDDKPLLSEFTEDYDKIIITLISENCANLLLDMSFRNKINNLYESKWIKLSENFSDPILKSYIYGLLGELNDLKNSFESSGSRGIYFDTLRKRFRNLYVKLHPELFAGCFPYEAFVDDWNDGEFY
ncbi:hypothetical protein [Peptoniphilus vaginalis]|uniref:hypothetical protein n=1 Tax=Peptoniphilus vaginalis TaxID=1756987 RepID=UPI000A267A57|nr:hypothetical protein [Peptoniphilus vaginalis]